MPTRASQRFAIDADFLPSLLTMLAKDSPVEQNTPHAPHAPAPTGVTVEP